MKIQEILIKAIENVARSAGAEARGFVLEHPADSAYGDYSTNVALVAAKKAGKNPRELAEEAVTVLQKADLPNVERIEVAGPGFINFFLSKQFFVDAASIIVAEKDSFGRNENLLDKKVMVEYTDPNPFKVFHIGHLMTNIIGESIARLFEFSGAEVKRANYQGDMGLHVAKALWGILRTKADMPDESSPLILRIGYLGDAYTLGANAYEEDAVAKEAIHHINKKIYEGGDEELQRLYDLGRRWSLDHFEEIYHTLGTKFDFYFFESQTGPIGTEIVRAFLTQGIFEESDGAVIFRGEKYGLHTRVFLTSAGLPPYEAKDLALAKVKYEAYPYEQSIVITASEQTPYWQVVKKAMSFVFPELAEKTRHIGHGMMRFASGKMSSRKGNIITGESLLSEAIETARLRRKGAASTGKAQVEAEMDMMEFDRIAGMVGVGALKYAVLRQETGRDIIYDAEQSFSLEGDSGPYLQYAYVRARSVTEKAPGENMAMDARARPHDEEVTAVERLLYQFPEVVERSQTDYSSHHITTYLTRLASAFNSYYAQQKIIDANDPLSPYRVQLASATAIVLKNGLYLLGIEAPPRM